jgi:hypothetical protein
MNKLLLFLSALLLIGCSPVLTNEEIVKEIQYCRDNDMRVSVDYRWIIVPLDPVRIVCSPRFSDY